MQMVILSAPWLLESISKIRILASPDHRVISGLSKQFFPMLKYHNPKLVLQFEKRSETEKLEITFTDESTETLPLWEASSMHAVAQTTLEMNRKKNLEILAARQKK